jgi:predicted transcriptional regulator of viral defense system
MDKYDKIIKECNIDRHILEQLLDNGILERIIYANKLQEYNMNKHILKQLLDNGILERIMHGVYASPQKDVNEFWMMSERYKNGIFSHNTALYLYGMTDRTPIKLDMTFPSNNRVNNEYLNVHYIKKENHKLGATKLKLEDETEINIYNIERTICDIIRDRNKIDPQIFNNAMNEYIKRKDKNLVLLYEYAKEFKIEKILARYMEVLQ